MAIEITAGSVKSVVVDLSVVSIYESYVCVTDELQGPKIEAFT